MDINKNSTPALPLSMLNSVSLGEMNIAPNEGRMTYYTHRKRLQSTKLSPANGLKNVACIPIPAVINCYCDTSSLKLVAPVAQGRDSMF